MGKKVLNVLGGKLHFFAQKCDFAPKLGAKNEQKLPGKMEDTIGLTSKITFFIKDKSNHILGW